MKVRISPSRKMFLLTNTILLGCISIICVLPFLHVLWASMSSPTKVQLHRGIILLPMDFTLKSYELVFSKDTLISGYRITLFVTGVGTAISLLLTSLGAYVLANKSAMLNKFLLRFVTVTMFVSGGLIPFYLLVTTIGLNGSVWALILPYCLNTWNMLVMRASFRTIPDSIEESTRIDGASELTILFRIVIPLSMPVVAVMILFYALSYWNSWFPASLFIRRRELFPIQLTMRELLLLTQSSTMLGTSAEISSLGDEVGMENYVEMLKYTTIVVSTLPIILVYPFLQKYFVKGILVGSLKE
ncbi:MAG: carbohydrate ABC transporter permease [Christensenellales bacterium]|jgi:putative aldouronate transport system permease protein